ncbi:AAA family ATPase [Candidatus Accumulibacter phosphatis]|uniref:AAA family ATPase n=1 Tax=Candidatus Accumulibacter phosphatis TaxID=327160 RepID=A0ABX1TUD1_9PROT|nr:AAA family ATPase [Candidatus Accumulibacter phosphatis]NMQ27881.1 AAA family ATPase [Candidatus Accumulibacter phosphatis]
MRGARPEHRPSKEAAPEREYAGTVQISRASDVKIEPVSWIWNGWLAAGKLQILGGAPGTGKTTIAMSMSAALTAGGRWPDGTRASVGNAVIWSGEDDPADTLIPRLVLSGANLSRVHFIDGVQEGHEKRSFDPSKDMPALRRKLLEIGDVRLLVVDPIVSAIAGDSHKNAEVRRGLQPLADLAASMKCALLGITHFSKGTGGRDPVERITGSLAFGAVARIVLVAARQQEEAEDGRTVRLLLRAKSNIGPDDGGFEYDLQPAELKSHPGIFSSSVQWGVAVEGAARDLLATADATGDDAGGGSPLADAMHFLEVELAEGARAVTELESAAGSAGHSWATVRRAKKALKIEAQKGGMKAGWVWELPRRCSSSSEDANKKGLAPSGSVEHLRGDQSIVEVEI